MYRIAQDCYVSEVSRDLVKQGAAHRLTKLQFRLLEQLCIHIGHIVETKGLIQHAWGDGKTVSKQELYVYMAQLRALLDGSAKIITIREKGYILIANRTV